MTLFFAPRTGPARRPASTHAPLLTLLLLGLWLAALLLGTPHVAAQTAGTAAKPAATAQGTTKPAAPKKTQKPAKPAKPAAAPPPPPLPLDASRPPALAARQYLLIDLASWQVLTERGADERAEPASLTKLMTAYLAFNALRDGKLKLEQQLPVSERAWNERKGGASVMFIDPKMTPTVDQLLHGLIVQSGNDAAVALAEGVAGTVEAFVDAMNRQAQTWGLKNTQFRNTSGITEPGHTSSARDVAFVAAKIIAEHPKYFAIYSVKSYTFNGIKQDNRNRLLGRDPTVDGMKTGRTDAAGWCLVATAVRDSPAGPRRLLSVVLGAESDEARSAETARLLEWGFGAFDAVKVFSARQSLATAPVWKGKLNEVPLGVEGALIATVPKGEGAKLKSEVTRTEPLLAPLAAAQAVGSVKVVNGSGATVATVPLVALQEVPAAGWFGRTWDALRLALK